MKAPIMNVFVVSDESSGNDILASNSSGFRGDISRRNEVSYKGASSYTSAPALSYSSNADVFPPNNYT